MKMKKLMDFASFLPKSKIKAGEALENGKYPFFTSSDIKHSYINNYLFDDELIVLGTGGFPSCNYYNGKFAVSTDNFVLKLDGTVLPKYLYYYLRKDNLQILANGFKGAGIKHVSKKYISDINVPVREVSAQKEIIGVLDSLSRSIEVEKESLSTLDYLIKSRFIERKETDYAA